MKYKFEISILEVQGIGDKQHDYKIALDSMEQQLYDTDTFEIYGQGNFYLGIFNGDKEVAGFKLPMKLLHGQSNRWFPLGLPYITLSKLENEVSLPRVFLSITEITALSPVIERRETSENSLQSSPELERSLETYIDVSFQQETNIKSEIQEFSQLELAHIDQFCHQVKDISFTSKQEVSKLREICEGLGDQMNGSIIEFEEKEKNYISEMKRIKLKMIEAEEKNMNLEVEITKVRNQNSLLKSQISMSQIFSTNIEPKPDLSGLLRDSEQKKRDLQEELKNLHLQLQTHIQTDTFNTQLKQENLNLMTQVKSINEKLKSTETNYQSKCEKHTNQVAELENENKKIAQSSQDLAEENYQLREALEQLRITLLRQEEENNELSYQLHSVNDKSKSKFDNIDAELKSYLQKLSIKNPFSKISDGVYNFGAKRVSVSLRKGIPVVRVGGGYMFIEEFLRVYSSQCKKKVEEEDDTPKRSRSSEPKLMKSKTVASINKEDLENISAYSNISDILNNSAGSRKMKPEQAIRENYIASVFKANILQQIPKQPTSDYTPLSSRRNKLRFI